MAPESTGSGHVQLRRLVGGTCLTAGWPGSTGTALALAPDCEHCRVGVVGEMCEIECVAHWYARCEAVGGIPVLPRSIWMRHVVEGRAKAFRDRNSGVVAE